MHTTPVRVCLSISIAVVDTEGLDVKYHMLLCAVALTLILQPMNYESGKMLHNTQMKAEKCYA